MQIRFPEFKTTLFYDMTNFTGNTENILRGILKETICRLPYSSLDQKQIEKIKIVIQNNYNEYRASS